MADSGWGAWVGAEPASRLRNSTRTARPSRHHTPTTLRWAKAAKLRSTQPIYKSHPVVRMGNGSQEMKGVIRRLNRPSSS